MTCSLSLGAAEWAERINLEVHGFASFGYLDTHNNNWMGDTNDGSSEFVEAAANVIARPGDRWRIGAQLFLRDFGKYDNAKPQLDWAYVDYRFRDQLGLQGGRVKFPLGLHNESWDVDAARTQVFLPRSVYDQRLRDLFIAIDGIKAYGNSDTLQYAVYLGDKTIDEEAGFGTYFEAGSGFAADDIEVAYVAGGMIDWAPTYNLNLRFSAYHLAGLEARGTLPAPPISNHLDIDYDLLIASVRYEFDDWTIESELSHRRGRGIIEVPAIALRDDFEDDQTGCYLAATWHLTPEWDCYIAQEYAYLDYNQLSQTYDEWTTVIATAYRPLENWSLKAEFQYIDGQVSGLVDDNPGGLQETWNMIALKTTVDF